MKVDGAQYPAGILPAPRRRAMDTDAEAAARVAVSASTPLLAEALVALLREHDLDATIIDTLRRWSPPAAADIAILAGSGVDLGRRVAALRRSYPVARIVVLVSQTDPGLIEEAFGLEVDGLIDGERRGIDLVHALHIVRSGRRVFPAPAAAEGPTAGLSRRQLAVLRLVAQGHSNSEIAGELVITVNTVKFHVREIFHELQIHNRVEAAQVWATAHGQAHSFG